MSSRSSWAGGAGTRLFPLTKDRSKPAVPLAGKYRLVDIPISNCLNSDLRRIFLLTQFNSGSLHRHIQESYRFDTFSPGFVEILAAEQRPDRMDWYQGTADAVRQNLVHLESYPHRLRAHSLGRPALPDGLLRTSSSSTWRRGRGDGGDDAGARGGGRRLRHHGGGGATGGSPASSRSPTTRRCWPRCAAIPNDLPASMGIYVFDREVLADALAGNEVDFGKHIIPRLIETRRVHAYRHGATGRTSGPSARSTRPTSISASRCRASISTTPARRSSPTRATCRPPRSSRAGSSAPIIADGCIINDAAHRALAARRPEPGRGRRHASGTPW